MTDREYQVLNTLSEMTDQELATAMDYMVGVVAARVYAAGLNVGYPPTSLGIWDVSALIRRTREFETSVQRQIEHQRRDDARPKKSRL